MRIVCASMKRLRKVAATAGVGIGGLGLVVIHIGKGLLSLVDTGGNVKDAIAAIDKVQAAGTVNAWNALAAGMAILGTVLLILAIWRRGPFKISGVSSGLAQTLPPEHAVRNVKDIPTVLGIHGPMDLMAFGRLKAIRLHCLIEKSAESRFRCIVEIEFFALAPSSPSPSQLRL